MDYRTLHYYKFNTKGLFLRYQSCEDGIPESFKVTSKVLDIGSRSGKDLLSLLDL